jgi:hypothetical protein
MEIQNLEQQRGARCSEIDVPVFLSRSGCGTVATNRLEVGAKAVVSTAELVENHRLRILLQLQPAKDDNGQFRTMA